MRYYKKDIAFEQIRTAIILFFQDIWPIATNTLLHATKVMLEDLERKKWGNERMEMYLNPKLTEKEKKDFFNKLNVFPNFCKHSNKDTKDYLDSDVQLIDLNELQIYMCIRLYNNVFWQDDLSKSVFGIYVAYIIATGRFDYLFTQFEYWFPEMFKEIKELQKSLNLTKDNPNLKYEFYKSLMKHQDV